MNTSEILAIENYPHYYCDISGNIYHFKHGELVLLHPWFNKNQMLVRLYTDIVSVARIVATTFIENDIPENSRVFHIDGDPGNNRVDNLVWVSPKEMRMLSAIDIPMRLVALAKIRKENEELDRQMTLASGGRQV